MRIAVSRVTTLLFLVLPVGAAGLFNPVGAQENRLPKYLRDRGTGVPASMFGTYIRRGELLVYPFFEYSCDHNREYSPAKLGLGLDQEYRGGYRASAGQVFIGYGLADWCALEVEAAFISAQLERSPGDTSPIPARIKQRCLTDVAGQLRVRVMQESAHRPEIFAYAEITVPSQKEERLIGDRDWDLQPGVGIVRGYSWGTLTLRSTVEYTREDAGLNIGETAVEYLKRLSPASRLHLALEGGEGGAPDEWDLVPGLQWRMTDAVFLKFDIALGLSSKATDWAPAMGVLFSFPQSGDHRQP